MSYPEMNSTFRGAHADITVFRAHRLPGFETALVFNRGKDYERRFMLSDADARTLAHLLLRSVGDEPLPEVGS